MIDEKDLPGSAGESPDPAAKEATGTPPTEPVAPPDTLEERVAALEARVLALETSAVLPEPTAAEPELGGPTSGFWECLNPKCANARPNPNAPAALFAGPVQSAAREAVTCPACGGAQVIYDHDAPTEEGGKE